MTFATAHEASIDVSEQQPVEHLLDRDHVRQTIDEPGIDQAEQGEFLRAHAAAKGLGHVVDAMLGGRGDEALEVCLVEFIVPIATKTTASVLERAQRLAKRLVEGTPDGHDLADGLHARRKRRIASRELLEGEARNLDDDVIDRRLEACRRGLGDVVHDLVERVADGELGRHLGNGKARRLGGECRRAAHTWIHLDDDEAPIARIDGELHVRSTARHADFLEDGKRGIAHALVLHVRERLGRRDGDRIARMHAHGVEVLDGADDDAVAGRIAHDLHLVFLPTDDGFLDEDLASR